MKNMMILDTVKCPSKYTYSNVEFHLLLMLKRTNPFIISF